MILTVTMNPSIDIAYPLASLKLDTTNRVKRVSRTAGGKGLNVARVIHDMEEEVMATGLIAGYYGDYLTHLLDQAGIEHHFTQLAAGETRECIAILHDQGLQTEILEPGPMVSHQDAQNFLKLFRSLMDKSDLLVVSGSLARGLPDDFYSQLIALAHQAGRQVVLDTSGQPLKNALAGHDKPDLIKPNQDELADLVGYPIENQDNLVKACQEDLFADIPWLVVSLGKNGAILKHQGKLYKANIPSLTKVVNPVGSGDAAVAGMAVALLENRSPEDLLKYGQTAGMLNALEEATGHINFSRFDQLYQQIEVITL